LHRRCIALERELEVGHLAVGIESARGEQGRGEEGFSREGIRISGAHVVLICTIRVPDSVDMCTRAHDGLIVATELLSSFDNLDRNRRTKPVET
jgi:hypothetical protein